MLLKMPGKSYSGKLPPLMESDKKLLEKLQQHIHTLSNNIGERNLNYFENLEKSASYIADVWKKNQMQIDSYLFSTLPIKNIIIEIPGTSKKDEIILIAAHYDSVFGSPGATDNATGVAAILELANLLKQPLLRTVRLVAF